MSNNWSETGTGRFAKIAWGNKPGSDTNSPKHQLNTMLESVHLSLICKNQSSDRAFRADNINSGISQLLLRR